MTHKTKWLL